MDWENWELLAADRAFQTVMVALFGICIGSFLNVCIWRMPRGESVVFAPSHCPKCNHPIRFYENIPLVSYLCLRGRCSSCHEPISPRYWLIELLTGVLFVGIFACAAAAGFGFGAILPFLAVLPLLVAGSVIDIEHRLVPDALTLPTALAGIVLAAALPQNWPLANGSHLAAGVLAFGSGVAVWLALLLLAWGGKKLFKQEALGGGDVKFMAAIAAVLGVWAVPVVLLVGSLGGAGFGIAAALARRRPLRSETVAFAPWLSCGVLVWCLGWPWLLKWL